MLHIYVQLFVQRDAPEKLPQKSFLSAVLTGAVGPSAAYGRRCGAARLGPAVGLGGGRQDFPRLGCLQGEESK